MPPQEAEMLRFLGLTEVDQLFEDIPSELRTNGLHLPSGLDEATTVGRIHGILARNDSCANMLNFLGAGCYDMYVPAVVDAILSRSEFYTSYTPYQAEISQGLLQALFEYQSLICELTGMDAANSSMYDSSTALGEAALMCYRITRKREFVIPRVLHPDRKAVLRNYLKGPGLVMREVDYDRSKGTLDLDMLSDLVGEETGGIYLENPNFFGLLEEGALEMKQLYPGTLLVVGANPLALGVLKAPGDYGADIVIGEGQCLGSWMNLGGPSLGLFACRKEYVRKMPGRVIGLTRDAGDRRAFCMTLQTREQHIRRERAMSNICTNEALLAIGAAVYIAQKGGRGLKELGTSLIQKARDLMLRIDRLDNFQAPIFPGYYFNEFPVKTTFSYDKVHKHLLGMGIHGGLELSSIFQEFGSSTLLSVTDRHTPEDFDRLVAALGLLK